MLFFKYIPGLYQGADHTGRRVMNVGGGGGGGGPTTSTVTQSSIPEWLRPQTESLLGAATQEIFNTEFNPATGTYDITGTKGYTPYSSDPRDYLAGFTPQEEAVPPRAAVPIDANPPFLLALLPPPNRLLAPLLPRAAAVLLGLIFLPLPLN